MALLPNGPQTGAKYVLLGPDGTRAVFNDPKDPDFVGAIQEISGFDSPEVRENAEDIVGMDGGIHGNFYYGRRPITLSGKIYNVVSNEDRNAKLTKLLQASNAMRSNATLTWIPEGGEESFIEVRRQQPVRITGGWAKDFQLAMVAADPRIYSTALQSNFTTASGVITTGGFGFPMKLPLTFGGGSVQGQVFCTNSGSYETFPVITIAGPCYNPSIVNFTTGQRIVMAYNLGSTDTFVIDMLNRTITLNGSFSRYSSVNFTETKWFAFVPGINDIRFVANEFGAGCTMTINWRDAWI